MPEKDDHPSALFQMGGGEFEFSPIVFDMLQYVDVKSSVKSVPAIKIRKLSRNHFGFLCFFRLFNILHQPGDEFEIGFKTDPPICLPCLQK